MASPEYVDEQKLEAKPVLPSVEEKQVLPVGEKRRRWMEPLLRGVAIVVSLIGGIASVCLVVFSYTPLQQNPWSTRLEILGIVALVLVGLVGVGGAVLFRSWWAILVVPVTLSLGALLTYYLYPKLISPNPYGIDMVALEIWGHILLMPVIAVIGACIGSYLGTLWKKRQSL